MEESVCEISEIAFYMLSMEDQQILNRFCYHTRDFIKDIENIPDVIKIYYPEYYYYFKKYIDNIEIVKSALIICTLKKI